MYMVQDVNRNEQVMKINSDEVCEGQMFRVFSICTAE